jgi:hypothetical protein
MKFHEAELDRCRKCLDEAISDPDADCVIHLLFEVKTSLARIFAMSKEREEEFRMCINLLELCLVGMDSLPLKHLKAYRECIALIKETPNTKQTVIDVTAKLDRAGIDTFRAIR